MTAAKKKQAMTANKSQVTYKESGPKNPMAYPIGIPSTPSPREAHIMKLAVFCFDSLQPYQSGRAKQSANMEAKNIPFRNDPTNAANHSCPDIAAIKFITQPITIPIIRIFSLRDTFIVTQMSIILNTVLVTQNTQLAKAAYCRVATFSITAYDETQLPYPTSCPIQRVYNIQIIAYDVLLIGFAIYVTLPSSPLSGFCKKRQKTLQKAKIIPKIKQLLLPNIATRKGPTNPPIPKTVCRSWIQKSCPSPRQSFIVQTLQVTLIMIQQHAPTKSVNERLIKVRENDDSMKEIPPMKMDPISIRWRANRYNKYLTMKPPATYPKALAKKTNEKYGYGLPDQWAKQGIIGPIAVIMLPQNTNAKQQKKKLANLQSNSILVESFNIVSNLVIKCHRFIILQIILQIMLILSRRTIRIYIIILFELHNLRFLLLLLSWHIVCLIYQACYLSEASLLILGSTHQHFRHTNLGRRCSWINTFGLIVLNNLVGQFSEQILSQNIRIELHVSERHKLHYVPCCFLPLGSKQSLISIESVHIIEAGLTHSDDDNGQRQVTTVYNQIDDLFHIVNLAISKDQQCLIDECFSFLA